MHISQAEARRLKKRVEELEDRDRRRSNAFVRDYPGGVNVGQLTYTQDTDFIPTVVRTSRKLGHAVVLVDDGCKVLLYAIKN
jgi:hypothetical protein